MPLKSLLKRINRNEVNKAFINYRDEEGKIKNICYQDGVFFQVVDKRKIRFSNPIRVAETIQKIENKELKLVGSGKYVQPVNFRKQYKKIENKRRG